MKFTKLAVSTGLLLAVLPLTAVCQAPSKYKPGDTLKLTIKYDGPDSDKIGFAMAYIELQGAIPSDQAGFQNSIDCRGSQAQGPHAITISCTIPPSAAHGTYKITQLRLGTGEPQEISVVYPQSEIPEFRIEVEDMKKFEAPTVKSITDR